MKLLRVLIAAMLIVCLTSAAPVFAKSKTSSKNLKGLKSKTLSMTTVKVKWKKIQGVKKYVIYKVYWKDGKEKHKKLRSVSGKKKSAVLKIGKNKEAKLYIKGVKKKKHGKKVVYGGCITVFSGLPTPEWSGGEAECLCNPNLICLSFVVAAKGLEPSGYEIYRKEVGAQEYKWIGTAKAYGNPGGNDSSVKPGKYYYYKVRCCLKSGKKIYRGKMSKPRLLGAVNNIGEYKLDTKTDEDAITVKLTSDPLNGETVIDPSDLREAGCPAKEENVCLIADSYSLDGKSWISVQSARDPITLHPKENLWIRLQKKQDAKKYDEYIRSSKPLGSISIDCTYRDLNNATLYLNAYSENVSCYIPDVM